MMIRFNYSAVMTERRRNSYLGGMERRGCREVFLPVPLLVVELVGIILRSDVDDNRGVGVLAKHLV